MQVDLLGLAGLPVVEVHAAIPTAERVVPRGRPERRIHAGRTPANARSNLVFSGDTGPLPSR